MICPDYYPTFKCKCGDCRSVCCGRWGITVSADEYFRLLGLECSSDLRYRLDCAFAKLDDADEERYAVMSPSYDGFCRMLSPEGLCSLQVELGEDVLPAVCRAYPRSSFDGEAACAASCEGVVELLMRESPLIIPDEIGKTRYGCIQTVQNRSTPLSDRLLTLAKGIYGDDIPALSGSISGATAFLTEINSLFAMHSPGLEHYCVPALEKLSGDNADEVYKNALTKFNKSFKSGDEYLENLLVNHMFLTKFPQENPRLSFPALCALYALIKICTVFQNTPESYSDCVAALMRFAEHTHFDYNVAVILKRLGMLDNTGFISLIIN